MPTSMVIETKVGAELSRPQPGRFEHGEKPPIHQIGQKSPQLSSDSFIEQNKSTFKLASIKFVLDRAWFVYGVRFEHLGHYSHLKLTLILEDAKKGQNRYKKKFSTVFRLLNNVVGVVVFTRDKYHSPEQQPHQHKNQKIKTHQNNNNAIVLTLENPDQVSIKQKKWSSLIKMILRGCGERCA
jgi:hypothetical protein